MPSMPSAKSRAPKTAPRAAKRGTPHVHAGSWDRVGRDGLEQALNDLDVLKRLWLNVAIRAGQTMAELAVIQNIAGTRNGEEDAEENHEKVDEVFREAWSKIGEHVLEFIEDQHEKPNVE